MSVHLEWKTLPSNPSNIWIVMTALGTVQYDEVKIKLKKLQETFDYFQAHFAQTHKFVLVFDFSRCQDFAKMAMLGDLKTFLTKNDAFIKRHLDRSYILLRLTIWKVFLDIIFAFRPPTRPYAFKMDPRLYEVVRFR